MADFPGLRRFGRQLAAIFAPPFPGLAIIVWCYVVFAQVGLPRNPVWRGDLPDPDDYTYLSHTLDWLQGQGWFDHWQTRMGIGGTDLHYTRLAELPIAAVILLFRAFHYSWHGAALLTSYLLPVLYLALFLNVARWAARPFAGAAWAGLSAFVALFGAALLFKFSPGQVDHHGLESILTLASLGCVARMFASPQLRRWPFAGAGLSACALAIALETLPWFSMTAAVVGLWGLAQARLAARPVAVYAATLGLTSLGGLLLERNGAALMQPDLLSYSLAYVELAGVAVVGLLAVALYARVSQPRLRWALGLATAALLAGGYLWRYPDLLHGPYGAMDPRLARLFFANLEEAEPLFARHGLYSGLLLIAPCLLAGIVAVRRAWRERGWHWILLAALSIAATSLAVFYQIRLLVYAQLFAIVPLTAFARTGWDWLQRHSAGRPRFWAEIGLIALLGPLTAIILPALVDNRSFATGMLLFPAQGFDDTCEMSGLEKVLNDPRLTGRGPLTIAAMIDQGPELLFRTPHRVLSAPYHTDVQGNLDMLDFFAATDDDMAHALVIRDKIALVVLCKDIPDMYLHGDGPHYLLWPNGMKSLQSDPALAARLAFHQPPEWLREVTVPQPSNYQLFEVH